MCFGVIWCGCDLFENCDTLSAPASALAAFSPLGAPAPAPLGPPLFLVVVDVVVVVGEVVVVAPPLSAHLPYARCEKGGCLG